jgi:hypothetical protein
MKLRRREFSALLHGAGAGASSLAERANVEKSDPPPSWNARLA